MSDDVGNGPMQLSDTTSEFNATSFIIQQALMQTRTMVLAKVTKVSNAGGLEPVGTVDVQPLVNFLDGAGVATPHGILTGLPYTRIQGGKNAIILDPEVDDIGWVAVSDRDISSVKNAKAQANPGSARTFDLMDGVYLGGILNGTPENYVRFNGTDVEVVSTTKIKIVAPTVELNASTAFNVTSPTSTFTGNLTVTGAIQAASAAITGAITAASVALTGALSAASAAFTGALSAASGAFTGALTSNTMQAATTVKSDAGAHSLSSHVHAYSAPSSGAVPANTAGPTG